MFCCFAGGVWELNCAKNTTDFTINLLPGRYYQYYFEVRFARHFVQHNESLLLLVLTATSVPVLLR